MPAIDEDGIGHRLGAEDHVVRNRQDRHEHEVLVDHADAALDRVRRTGDLNGLTVQQDLPLVGFGKAVEDVHERRLARAVLAEQRVDLAGTHIEVDVIVGDDARISLGHAAHLQRGNAGPSVLGHGCLAVMRCAEYDERADRKADPLEDYRVLRTSCSTYRRCPGKS